MADELEVSIEALARGFTSKQMGDACEMLVAAELTLAGIPALKAPDNWPHYDVIAQSKTGDAHRISVKSRTFKSGAGFVRYKADDQFDWLAIVILSGSTGAEREFYLVPRSVADHYARKDSPTSKTAHQREFRIDEVGCLFAGYRDNFGLRQSPSAHPACTRSPTCPRFKRGQTDGRAQLCPDSGSPNGRSPSVEGLGI